MALIVKVGTRSRKSDNLNYIYRGVNLQLILQIES